MIRKKVSIIGAGNVGATLANYIAIRNMADLVLIDIEKEPAQGKALDIKETAPVFGFDIDITGSNDYQHIKDSDIVVITAGVARKPGMNRLDLLKINASIIESIIDSIVKYAPNSFIIMVTNPVDVLTYLALKKSKFDKNRVIGQAGVLDGARFAYFISDFLKVSIQNINPMVLGGHGNTMIPLVKNTTVSGIPVDALIPRPDLEKIIDRTKNGGAEIVQLLKTGSAYYAPAAATMKMVEAILYDRKLITPCSVLLEGEYDINDVCIGVPVKLGSNGMEEIIQISLSDKEKTALKSSAKIYQESIEQVS